MNSRKIALIVLVGIAVAFAVGVGAPFLSPSGDGEKGMTEEEAIAKARGLEKAWVGALSRGLDFLRPSLDIRRLSPPSPCRIGQKSFRLTDETPCLVQVSPKESGSGGWIAFEEMEFGADPAAVSLQVCRCESATGAVSRGPEMRVTPGRLVKFRDRMRLPPHGGVGPAGRKRPELMVSYFPMGEAVTSGCPGGKVLVCEEVKEISLVVEEAGGTARLACEGCTAPNPAVVTLR